MAEEQTYLDPADYPFADFRDPPVQVVDYQGEYGSGQSLAMKELVEIANRLGYIMTLQLMSVQQVDFTVVFIEWWFNQLWGSAVENLLEFFMPPTVKGGTDGGRLVGWVFDSSPSGGWQSEDVPEQWRISTFDQVWTSLVKTAWETDSYVHSATYEHDVKGERGIKCFKDGEPLWHKPIGCMVNDLKDAKFVVGAYPFDTSDYSGLVDKDGDSIDVLKSITVYWQTRNTGGDNWEWEEIYRDEKEAAQYKGTFDFSVMKGNVWEGKSTKWMDLSKGATALAGITVYKYEGDPSSSSGGEETYANYVAPYGISAQADDGGSIQSKVGELLESGKDYCEAPPGTLPAPPHETGRQYHYVCRVSFFLQRRDQLIEMKDF